MFRTEPLGSPGVYIRHAEPDATFSTERMDVCAFVGIAPRGPCRAPDLPEWWREEEGSFMPRWQARVIGTRRSVAVAVESFDEYRRLYGGFEGPGRLPYAVAAFFENGGRRAYIVRVVHDYGDINKDRKGVAVGEIGGVKLSNGEGLTLRARNEGAWGNRIRAALGLTVNPVAIVDADINGLVLNRHQQMPVGTLLRCHMPGARPQLRFVGDSRDAVIQGERKRRVEFALPLLDVPTAVETVEGEMSIEDGELIRERLMGLGLSSRHPRWLANELCYRSELVYPDPGWDNTDIEPVDADELPYKPRLPGPEQSQFEHGQDRFQSLIHDDFFDNAWLPGRFEAGDGVYAIAGNSEVASVAIPDLYCPEPLPDIAHETPLVSLAGAEFKPCVDIETDEEPPLALPEINQLCLDPALPGDRDQIVALQQRLVDFADTQRSWVALLDVPPGLRLHQTIAWRGRFDSSYAAAYFPWLRVFRGDDQRNRYVDLNPSAVAAGILAAREIVHGVHYGPANQLANTVVGLRDPVSPADHDRLHPLGLNAYLMEPGGIRLSAARTLAGDPAYRQLNVRRLMILIRRVLARQTQWAVFEPNGPPLWRQLSRMLESFLLKLYRAGAFRGATAEQAFFVRCNEQTNTRHTRDAGRLVAEIGVAPAEPMEFIVLRLTREGDGMLVREV